MEGAMMGRWHPCVEIGMSLIERNQVKIRFLLTGALNTIVGLAVYPTLYYLFLPLQFHYLVILTISQVICVTFAFLTTKFLVFRTSGNYLREFSKFGTFHLSVYLVNLMVLPVLVECSDMNPVWAQLSFTIVVIVSSYFWHSRITFSSRHELNQ
jgi:putative flippase GtrA